MHRRRLSTPIKLSKQHSASCRKYFRIIAIRVNGFLKASQQTFPFDQREECAILNVPSPLGPFFSGLETGPAGPQRVVRKYWQAQMHCEIARISLSSLHCAPHAVGFHPSGTGLTQVSHNPRAAGIAQASSVQRTGVFDRARSPPRALGLALRNTGIPQPISAPLLANYHFWVVRQTETHFCAYL